MAFTFVLSTNIGKVRLMAPDKVDSGHVFEDDEITAFLTLEGDNVKRATALALETMAADQALTLKVIKLLDLATDGAKVSDALLKRAAQLRAQADAEEAQAEEGAFDVAEMLPTDFAYRERVTSEALREGL